MANKPKIIYIEDDEALLDRIKPLWEALNLYHLGLSENFKQYYLDMTFQKRKAELLKKAGLGEMHVEIAVEKAGGKVVGYCVSSVTLEKMGEIKSIFVDESFRGMGIGAALMQKALIWLEQKGAVEKIIEVAAGNERVWGFYARHGFLPRKTMLKQVRKHKSSNSL